ncbi:hypothetical protein [Catenovulum adriaticum]|uniref:FAD dependent oxidoreductase n=1 Tax=Catenovulum adriaticum TaxID=2984846 RepID=A0ABY7AJ71_9ALTE|nr:hypothetical protein [Catenovulum sp. TS8]WAJ69375.1 hypothetical protein OLW01_09290 [Catenovulum sp. TS8]
MFDIVLIGSGLIAESFLEGLLQTEKPLKVCVVAPSGYPSSPLKTVELDGGLVTSMYSGCRGLGAGWHGVIPSKYIGNDESLKLLRSWYGDMRKQSLLCDSDSRVFVPYRVHRPKMRNLNSVHFISGLVRRIHGRDKNPSIELADGQMLACKKVYCAAGPINTYSLFARSSDLHDSFKLNSFMGDHVTAYLGYVSNKYSPPDMARHGGGFSYQTQLLHDCVIFKRPAVCDFNNADNVANYTRAWSNQKTDIIKKLITNGSAGLIGEALFNKFGIVLPSRGTNVYAQIESKQIFRLINNSWVTNEESLKKVFATISLLRAGVSGLSVPEKYKVGVGIHFFGNIQPLSSDSCIKVLDASIDQHLGPYHHTFFKCVKAYELGKCYDK